MEISTAGLLTPLLGMVLACNTGMGGESLVPSIGGTALGTEENLPPGCSEAQLTAASVCVEKVWPSQAFERPVWFGVAPGNSHHRFVVEKPGRIMVFDTRHPEKPAVVFLDHQSRVREKGNEEGLLSIAFHPKFATNGRIFLYYTASSPRRSVLSEMSVEGRAPGRVNAAQERVVLEVRQPYGNHNGGQLLFGPDGMLYLGLGDGGYADDPHDHGQNISTLLGSILRLNVDGDQPYVIPHDNPFAQDDAGRSEIWAWGLRNPWRMSFDQDDLWVGDVGQNKWEEVDVVRRGGNYGWRATEGKHCFERARCSKPGLLPPLWEYGRDQGVSITGGFVVRGGLAPSLKGTYLFGDFGSGSIWGLCRPAGKETVVRRLWSDPGLGLASFGRDLDGSVILVGFGGGLHRVRENCGLQGG